MSTNSIDDILNERGNRYGVFVRTAEISQRLTELIFSYKPRGSYTYDQAEAIEMILHKLARLTNGDPDYIDNWVDIAGYATLVSDRLKGALNDR